MIPDARIHYTITNGGGAPNVVPAYAEAYYFIRSPKRQQVDELYQRVINVAKGAAMMTETEMEIDFLSGTYNTIENDVIGNVIQKNMEEIGPVKWTEEDLSFAKEMRKTITENSFERIRHLLPQGYDADALFEKLICDTILPGVGENQVLHGSTDVADVSWVIPLAQFATATQITGSPGHSWQNVACGRMSIGHKGMLLAAKVIATTICDFLTDDQLIDKAKEEFEQTQKVQKYISPFPEGHKPPYHRLQPDILQYP
jgi:aminobenzoyl-glutamate utilization protein B